MTYHFEYDPESRAGYIKLRTGEYSQTIPLTPNLGVGVDVDEEGFVLGIEFLSFEEYAAVIERAGGTLELPERIEDPANFKLSPA